ncbi:dihydrofolate reductase [Mumia flava]|uniref:Dihydrofolate reductase n=1 Tax=Mumia flava TaxID=1348852 RepID=A0A0B2B3L8_9ACTN|nr:dihydrofolate reductase family protein [Mumia flava]PJJ53447.1 dihydrofolate reductase [Mumia flava]
MSDLMIDCITSLDGFGAAEGWPGLWGLGGPEYFELLETDPHRHDTLLMGATTYRLFEEFLRTGEPGIEALAEIPKVVFSSTLTEPLAWERTTLVSSDATEAVRTMKRESDAGLRTLGSPTLCRSLLEAGLVDRYRVVVFPVVNGATGQDRMYDGWPDVALDLIESRTLDGRLQLLEYAPTVLDGPPGTDATA